MASQSSTRKMISALGRSGSAGGIIATVGLSAVGGPAGREQKPVSEQVEHNRRTAVLAIDRGVEDVDVPIPAGVDVGDN